MKIQCIFYEFEDNLPNMTDCEFDLIFGQSKIIDGVRMYPYVLLEKEDDSGELEKVYLA